MTGPTVAPSSRVAVPCSTMGKDEDWRRCPECDGIVGRWREQCDCGWSFREQKVVPRRRAGEPNRAAYVAPELRGDVPSDRDRRDPTGRDVARGRRGTPTAAWVVGAAAVALVLVGITEYPLQTIAGAVVVGVLVYILR